MKQEEVYGIIYKITNKVNGKVYIGQTIDKSGFKGRYRRKGEGIERVYRYHKSIKEQKGNYNVYLLRSIEKYGFEAFEVIEEFDTAYSKEELDYLEIKYIKMFNCINPNGYNSASGGSNGKHCEKTIENISEKVVCLNTKKIFTSAKKACEFYNLKLNNNKHIGEICNNIEFKRGRKYCGTLENGERLTWLYYKDYIKLSDYEIEQRVKIAQQDTSSKNNPNATKIICITTNEVFYSIAEASRKYNINESSIRQTCNSKNNRKVAGKSIDGTPLQWLYYEEYLKMSQEEIDNIKKQYRSRKVICLETKEVFKTSLEASDKYNCSYSGINKCCNGKAKSSGGYHWMFYDCYIRENEIVS